MLTLDVRHDPDGTTVITAVGTVDISTAGRLSATIHHQLDDRPAAIVVDLTGVSCLDTAALRILKCVTERSEATGVPVRLILPPNPEPEASGGGPGSMGSWHSLALP